MGKRFRWFHRFCEASLIRENAVLEKELDIAHNDIKVLQYQIRHIHSAYEQAQLMMAQFSQDLAVANLAYNPANGEFSPIDKPEKDGTMEKNPKDEVPQLKVLSDLDDEEDEQEDLGFDNNEDEDDEDNS